jgi:hypothetical protein
LITVTGAAFAETEDEIISKYLQKKEKIVKKKIGFVTGRFSYGVLPQQSGYGVVSFSASSDLASVDGAIIPHEGIYRSNELSLQLGVMLKPRISLELGFDYWLQMGTPTTVDYTTTVGVLSTDDRFEQDSKVNVYGFGVSSNYYLHGYPQRDGRLSGFAVKAGLGAGYYMTSWSYWNEGENTSEPLKAGAPAFWLQGGLEYPLPFFNLVIGANGGYFYVNFGSFSSYNNQGGDMELTSAKDGQPLELDLSGLRAQFELKRYFTW